MKRYVSLAFVVCLAGCAPKQGEPPWYVVPAIEPIGELPQYRDLVERYNRNLAHLDRLWARADVTVTYRDDKGRKHSDRADDSKLLTIPPDHVALSLGGAFREAVWAGCDESRYWVFDLHGEDRPAYVGRRDNIGRLTTQPLPSPIYPQQLPRMLGLVPIDPPAAGGLSAESAVEWLNGYWFVEPPGTATRLQIDPRTGLPVRIDLIDASGRSVIAVRLSDPVPVECTGVPPAERPVVASRIEAWLLDQGAQVTIKLKHLTDGRGDRKKQRAFAAAFDFDRLVRAHQPGRLVDLDTGQPVQSNPD